MSRKVDFGSRAQREREIERERRDAEYLASEPRKYAPGPKLPTCEECPEFGCYGDNGEHYCSKHAPESLKRPGDFLPRP